MTLNRPPRLAAILGFAGLLPFCLLTLGLWLMESPAWLGFVLYLQLLYAAIVASFIGAVHWGLAMADASAAAREGTSGNVPAEAVSGRAATQDELFLFSVFPALAGWAILAVFHLVQRGWLELTLMIGLFAALYVADSRVVRRGLAPDWYLDLRRLLTLGVLGALVISLARVVLA